MKKKPFKPQLFVCPIGPYTNRTIAFHPSLSQVDPLLETDCYFGNSIIKASLYPIDERLYKSIKKHNELSFYVFIQNTKEGRKQYCYSQNIKATNGDIFAKQMEGLLEKLLKMKEKKNKQVKIEN